MGAVARPVQLVLELTWACPLRCPFCHNPSRRAHLELAEIVRVLREAAGAGFIQVTITGGEPTIHPDFLEVVHTARELDFGVRLITSGERLSDVGFARRVAAEELDQVQVSVHGDRRTTNELMVGGRRDVYTSQMQAIDTLIRLGVAARTNFVVVPDNLDQIGRFSQDMRALGVRDLQFAPVYCAGHAAGNEELFLTADQWRRAARAISRVRRQYPDTVVRSEIAVQPPRRRQASMTALCIGADGYLRPFESAPTLTTEYSHIDEGTIGRAWKESPALLEWRRDWTALRDSFHRAAVPVAHEVWESC